MNKYDNQNLNYYVNKLSHIPIDPPDTKNIQLWYDKFNSLKTLYQERLQDIGNRFKIIFFNISTDEVINTMRNDASTSEFAKERMGEILTSVMAEEKELALSNTFDELTNTKTQLNEAQIQIAELSRALHKKENEYDDLKLQMKRMTDEIRYKESDVYKKHEENTHLMRQISDLSMNLKTRESDMYTKDKEISSLTQRLKTAYDKNADLEAIMRTYKEEVHALTLRNTDLKKTMDSLYEKNASIEKEKFKLANDSNNTHDKLTEKLAHIENYKKRLAEEVESLRETLNATEQERNNLRDRLNDAANKFEQTFTKQEGVYESQYLDMKDKHKRMKQKLIEDRAEFERQMSSLKDDFKGVQNSYENKITKLKQEIEKNNNTYDAKIKEITTQNNYDMQSLKKKYENDFESKSQQLNYEFQSRNKQFEAKDAEINAKLEDMNKKLKTDYVLKERHDHLLLKAMEDAENKWKKTVDDLIRQNEEIGSKNMDELQMKMSKELEKKIKLYDELKKDYDSAKHKQKEQIKEYDRMLNEEVEKRRKAFDQLSKESESKVKSQSDLENLKDNHEKVTKECNYYKQEVSRLASLLTESDNENSSFENKIKELTQIIDNANEQSNTLNSTLTRVQDDNNDLKFKLKDAQNKFTELKETNKDLHSKINQLSENLEQEKNKFYEKSFEFQNQQMSLKDEFNEKIEKEKLLHRETVSKMHKLEISIKEYQTKYNEANEKSSILKNDIVLLKNDLAIKVEYIEKLLKEVKELENSELNSKVEFKRKINVVKSQAKKHLTYALKKIDVMKLEIAALKKFINFDRLKSDLSESLAGINHKKNGVLKDIRYSHLGVCRKLADKMANECTIKINDKTKYFEELLDKNIEEYESKIKIKEDKIYTITENLNQLKLENASLKTDYNQIENNIVQYKQREYEFKTELKSYAEKIILLKEMNEAAKNSNEESISQLKQEISEYYEDRESNMKKDFIAELDALNDALKIKFSSLLEMHNHIVESAVEMKNDLDAVKNESEKQSEYMQAHHNDYLRYSKEVYTKLKDENDQVKEFLAETELKYKNELQRLEQKFIEVAQKSELEFDNFSRFKHEKLTDLEKTQRANRESQKELQTKDAIIEDLARDKEEAFSRLKEYEMRLETEMNKRDAIIRTKDNEIYELHALLEKGYLVGGQEKRANNNSLDVQNHEMKSSMNRNDKNGSNGLRNKYRDY